MGVLHVACAAEPDYVAHSAAMLHSALEHSEGYRVHVHFMHGPDLRPRAKGRLAEMLAQNGATVSFVYVSDAAVAGLPTKGYTRKATWYRLFLPDLLPRTERILYLDADLLVVDSLTPLWETELSGHYLGAVTNVFERHHQHRPAELGLSGPDRYFNAGVMLMDVELMRRDGCAAALRSYALHHTERLLWRDQDTFNVVLGDRRLPLHPRWNCMNSVLWFPWSTNVFGAEAVEEARRHPAIRHFEGPASNKPWHYLCDDDLRALYFHHRRQTPWPRIRPSGLTPRNVVRRLLRDLRVTGRAARG